MIELSPARFPEFFRALYGYDPFPWQARLAATVAEGEWPEAIALPTAAGKTACIDIAVFALACQADRSNDQRTAPRRLFFVIDRRVVVDEAYRRARELARQLEIAGAGILKLVTDRLRSLSRDGSQPLACERLRGGTYREDLWIRSPSQPTVVISTVDQFGSRLLFRGYGVSATMAPVHAGLAGNDSLVILDEAHCALPFLETMRAIGRYRTWAERPLAGPFAFAIMSATPPAGAARIEGATDDDRAHPVLGQRLAASKPAVLIEAKKARGGQALERFAEDLVREARRICGGEPATVGIMVNRVATARLVREKLRAAGDHDVVLLTGRMRPLDRDRVLEQWMPYLEAKADRRPVERPLFIVATQTLEVGANLDFDALVTECASLDALRQRFGRLDRLGRRRTASAAILVQGPQSAADYDDPIYGRALANTWQWLSERADERDGQRIIDMGVEALGRSLESPEVNIAELVAPSDHAPVLLPAHLDAFAQTSPTPCPDPDPALFLHGSGRDAPEVQVCWRADLDPAHADNRKWVEAVTLVPPSSPECVSVPLWLIRSWLGAAIETAEGLADVEGMQATVEEDGNVSARPVIAWRGRGDTEVVMDPRQLRPGDTVVIPAVLGGWELLADLPDPLGEPSSADIGDAAYQDGRDLPVLRIHPAVLRSWPDDLRVRFEPFAALAEPPADEEVERLREALVDAALASITPEQAWLPIAAHRFADRRYPWTVLLHPCGGLILIGRRRLGLAEPEAHELRQDEVGSSATVPVSLADHSTGVRGRVMELASACGFPESVAQDLTLTAVCHDLGKADPRFQVMLHGGSELAAALNPEPLAKSDAVPLSPAERRQARVRSGLPQGFRHELISVRLLESAPDLLRGANDAELVLHLIASHHGRCRPFAPVVFDPDPVDVTCVLDGRPLRASSATGLEGVGEGVPDRFWRLVRRYGWWGLAWFEAVIRLADHQQSAAERERAEKPQTEVPA